MGHKHNGMESGHGSAQKLSKRKKISNIIWIIVEKLYNGRMLAQKL
jgi:hypothetical protein